MLASYRRQTHNHYCAFPGCKVVVAKCSAPEDYDGSPNRCEDEEIFEGWLCEDHLADAAEQAQEDRLGQ